MTAWASPILIGVGAFGSVGMLGWAAIALVPLLIHLWTRKQYRSADWAAMDFLLAAIQEQSRRLRIEQLLLLLLRVAIPIVFALAIADPLWQLTPLQSGSLGSRPPHHHVLLVDASYSMAADLEGSSALERARQFARDLVQQSPQGDGFTLLRMGSPAQAIVASPAYEKSDILAEIDAFTIEHATADLFSGLSLAQSTLRSARTSHPRLQKNRLYLLSDMQAHSWNSAQEGTVRQAVAEIADMAEIVVADVGRPVAPDRASNLALIDSQRTSTLPTLGRPMAWNVTIERWDPSVKACEVEMHVNGNLIQRVNVALTGESTNVRFNYRFDSVGHQRVSFHLPDDILNTDNHRYEIVNVRDYLRLLCLEGRPGAAKHLAIALNPTQHTECQVKMAPEHRMVSMLTEEVDAVFCCNLGSVTREQATHLRRYVSGGGSLVVFLGDQSSVTNLNLLLGQTESDGDDAMDGLLPAELIEVMPSGRYRWAPDDYRHPLVSSFRGQDGAGLLGTPIWSYVRMRPQEPGAQVALAFRNGDPAIVVGRSDGGSVVVVATPPSPLSTIEQAGRSQPWNAWSVWPSFLPMIQELLAFVVQGQGQQFNQIVGNSFGTRLPPEDLSRFVTVRTPTDSEYRVAVQDRIADRPGWSWSNTDHHGFYDVASVDGAMKTTFAVNIGNYDESNLERLDTSALPHQFQQHSIDVTDDVGAADIEATPLFRRCLCLLLALLLIESAVAWYFGNGR